MFTGIEWIIVFLEVDRTFAKQDSKFYKVTIPKILVINPMGSGDLTVTGIASALLHAEDDVQLLTKANVLGIFNSKENMTDPVILDNYDKLFKQIKV